MQDYFAERVERFIAVAPCLQVAMNAGYPHEAFSLNESWNEGFVFIPYTGSLYMEPAKPTIDCSKTKDKDCTYEPGFPMRSTHYFLQTSTEGRF